VTGHPGISWSIALNAVPAAPLDPAGAQARLDAAWPADGRVGPAPRIEVPDAGSGGFDAALAGLADRPYAAGEPLCRVAVEPGPPSRVVVAGHHAVLDGLGLVAVLGAALGSPLGTSARGAGAQRSGGSRLRSLAYPAVRLAEALVRPPARVAPDHGRQEGGDHLVRVSVTGRVGTADLVAACALAVAEWNAERGGRPGRVTVAVGASVRPGREPAIGRQATWFRIGVPAGASGEVVRRMMASRGPEPDQPRAALRAARAVGAAARLERRTGSTLLVSNLGRLMPEAAVLDAAFYPAAHGRSGLAVGAVGAGEGTTITVRARRADFSPDAAARFLDLAAGRFGGLGSVSTHAP